MAKKKTLKRVLRKAGARNKKQSGPVWKGPEVDGITQSLLSRFIVCKERFRLLVMEGLKSSEGFNKNLEFGNMWHCCEEEYARSKGQDDNWERTLLQYTKGLCQEYKLQQEEIIKWYNICKMQFPIYLDYWSRHKLRKKKIQLYQEQTFKVPYQLPSGRVVQLRGMWDGVSLIGSGKDDGLWLDEHKTKGDIKPEQIERQLNFDLQTMTYLVALQVWLKTDPTRRKNIKPIKGVVYNVVKRPLSGGKGSIRQHKPTKAKPKGESTADYYKRLEDVIRENETEFFMRWYVSISQKDIDRFKTEFLDPCLEHLCDWWAALSTQSKSLRHDKNHLHYRTPYGIYNVLAEGGSTDLDAYLATGNEVGLQRTNQLFPELQQ